MSIRICDLEKDERTCQVTFEGESAEVRYRPSAYTPAVEDALQSAIETNRPSGGVAKLLAGILIEWEVLDDEGKCLPTDAETLALLPSRFLFAVINVITADMGAEKEDRKNLGGGSFRRGK